MIGVQIQYRIVESSMPVLGFGAHHILAIIDQEGNVISELDGDLPQFNIPDFELVPREVVMSSIAVENGFAIHRSQTGDE